LSPFFPFNSKLLETPCLVADCFIAKAVFQRLNCIAHTSNSVQYQAVHKQMFDQSTSYTFDEDMLNTNVMTFL
jgi:hypothetical protein